jgi:hypothetical protein
LGVTTKKLSTAASLQLLLSTPKEHSRVAQPKQMVPAVTKEAKGCFQIDHLTSRYHCAQQACIIGMLGGKLACFAG